MTKSGFDIDELERLLAAATPGEWVACGWGDGSTPDGVTNIFNHDAEVLLMECLPVDDAALIVAARNSLPAILTEIRELRAENARLREALESKPWPPTDADLREMLALIVGAWWSESSANRLRTARMLNAEDIKGMYAVRDALAPYIARAALKGPSHD